MKISELEVECANCSGTGKIKLNVLPLRGGPTRYCPACNGTGQVLTPKGADLIAFVRRHLIRADVRGLASAD